MIFFARWTPAIYWSLVSKPVSQDIQSICYCLHTGIFRLDTCDLVVAGVPISISSKYLYLYLALKVLTLLFGSLFPVRLFCYFLVLIFSNTEGSISKAHCYFLNVLMTQLFVSKVQELSSRSGEGGCKIRQKRWPLASQSGSAIKESLLKVLLRPIIF